MNLMFKAKDLSLILLVIILFIITYTSDSAESAEEKNFKNPENENIKAFSLNIELVQIYPRF